MSGTHTWTEDGSDATRGTRSAHEAGRAKSPAGRGLGRGHSRSHSAARPLDRPAPHRRSPAGNGREGEAGNPLTIDTDGAELFKAVGNLLAAGADDRAYVNEAGAEAVLGVKRSTLRTWRSLGRGPRYFKAGRLVKYRVGDLHEWMESNARG